MVEYAELVKLLEDADDIAYLKAAREGELEFRPFHEYLKEREAGGD